MNRNGKALFAAAALMGGLLVGINGMVTDEGKQTNILWALILFGIALAFWLWMRRDDRPAQEKAVEAVERATDTLTTLRATPAPVSVPEAPTAVRGEPDDLTRIEGVGPKYRDILYEAGISTYAQLAVMSEAELVELAQAAGMRRRASMATWPEQARLAASGDWDGLEKLQNELSGGRR